jgi:polyribonucleotide nucleotidyltransferase
MVRVAREHVKSLVSAQDSLANPLGQEDDGLHYCIDESLNEPQVIALGKRLRPSYSVVPTDELLFSIRSVTWEKLQQVVRESSQVSARNRSEMLDRIESDTLQALRGNSELATREVLGRGFSVVLSEAVRDGVASTGIRADGRSSMQRREFDGEVSVLPFVHGSSLVNVGYTQSLCTVAVVSGEMNPPFQGYIAPKVRENLVVSWESPPYATRDAMRPWSAYGRSEVEKSEILKMSIRAVVPASLPFTVRLHADVLADDGSGISAAVSAASLALFDAGVAVSGHVAGVSIGLMSRTVGDDDAASDCRREEKEDQCIEKDSEEDLLIVDPSEIEEKGITSLLHVAGTNKGLTCVGLDTREGRLVEYHTLELAMSKAWQCLMQQIEDLEGVMGDVRGEMRKTESVAVFEIPPEKKVAVIGAKGRVVMSLEAATDTSISINDAVVTISGRDASNVERAKTMVLELVNSQGNASRISASFQVPVRGTF